MDFAGSLPGIGAEGWGAGGACEGLSKLRETGEGTYGVRYAGEERGEGEILKWADVVGRGVARHIRLKVRSSAIK